MKTNTHPKRKIQISVFFSALPVFSATKQQKKRNHPNPEVLLGLVNPCLSISRKSKNNIRKCRIQNLPTFLFSSFF